MPAKGARKGKSHKLKGVLSRTKKTSRVACSPTDGTRTEVRTTKLKLVGLTDEQKASILDTCKHYIAACNYVSEWVFSNGFPLAAGKVQKELYGDVREKFGLSAQLSCCVFRTVSARYRAVRTQMQRSPLVFVEDGMSKPIYVYRDLDWLWRPIRFKTPQCDQSRDRSYRFLKNGKVSFVVMKGTIAADFKPSPLFKELYSNSAWKMGTAKLERHGEDWYVAIPFEREVTVTVKPQKVIGLDRGIINQVTASDEARNIKYYSGNSIRYIRERFATTRAKLQSKGTWSAKRRLKSIDARENRWMSDVNHCLSKALVHEYGAGTLFVIENLVGVSKSAESNGKRNKKGRKEASDWAFYELECDLIYKAEAADAFALVVDGAYTSQRCPDCGKIDKEQRHHSEHAYACTCGYSHNDDATAAINLVELGKAFLNGIQEPCFRKGHAEVLDNAVLREEAIRRRKARNALEAEAPF